MQVADIRVKIRSVFARCSVCDFIDDKVVVLCQLQRFQNKTAKTRITFDEYVQ